MITAPPRKYFIVSGVGEAATPLNAFDAALHKAGVGDLNLLKVSSIIPPGCELIEPAAVKPGSLVFTAYAEITSSLPGEVIAAGVAAGIPREKDRAGVIMEYSARGRIHEIEEIVERMARDALEMRGLTVDRIDTRAVEIKVESVAAAFAAVVLL
jgi:arginine decarboxylase